MLKNEKWMAWVPWSGLLSQVAFGAFRVHLEF